MKRVIILLTSLGLIVVSILAADTLSPLKADARLNTTYHEVVTSRESKISTVGGSFIDTILGAFVPSCISLPSSTSIQAVIPITCGTAIAVSNPTNTTTRESVTAAIEIPSAMPAQAAWTATVTWATWTATVARVATGIATYTAGAEPSSPLLDRLVRNKPSIWGNKGFYILLGLVYVTLLGLFLKQVVSISGGGREQH